jgi:signal transduction histidine kinase
MNPISLFLLQNIIIVYFFYGLAFFVLGLVLALASRQPSEFRFARAIRPLALFGLLHGLHEWVEMFQKIKPLNDIYYPSPGGEIFRLTLLVSSFVMLLWFGVLLLAPPRLPRWQLLVGVAGLVVIWLASILIGNQTWNLSRNELIVLADVLARYTLGIPGAMLGTWALMTQQRTFREHNMPQFGRDLVWCASALFLYGAAGQLFVRQTALIPSFFVNEALFMAWFGIPVQLFRGILAAVFSIFIVRALKAFDLEKQRRLKAANQAKLAAQTAALEAERHISYEMERLNEELRLTTRELSLLLDLSNVLGASMSLQDRLYNVLRKIVHSLEFPESGMIVLSGRASGNLHVKVSSGFTEKNNGGNQQLQYNMARALGEECVQQGMAMCRHLDGQVIEFFIEEALERQQCRRYHSPTVMIGLPLTAQRQVIGSLVLAQSPSSARPLSYDEFKLMMGVAQQLGMSIENARLYQEAQHREKMLKELLHQVVGAQEAERKRIARELHDATGQSLTAMAMGLKGVETILETNAISDIVLNQVKQVKSFGTNALGELRQIISGLRPTQLDDLGLVAAIRWYTQDFQSRTGIETNFSLRGEAVRLLSEYETVLFRITQEALTNVAKHAGASTVNILLEVYSEQIKLTIQDDGRGFDPAAVINQTQPTGWGLMGISERTQLLGGHYNVTSASGQGTQIEIIVPLVMEMKHGENSIAAG